MNPLMSAITHTHTYFLMMAQRTLAVWVAQEVDSTLIGEDGLVVMAEVKISGMVSNASNTWFDTIPFAPFLTLL